MKFQFQFACASVLCIAHFPAFACDSNFSHIVSNQAETLAAEISECSVSVLNNGTILNKATQPYIEIYTDSSSTFINESSMYVFSMLNHGSVTNTGAFNNSFAGEVVNNGRILNSGRLDGSIRNYGTIVNSTSGQFSAIQLDNTGDLLNFGSMYWSGGYGNASISNSIGRFSNSGTIRNMGAMTSYYYVDIKNSGRIENSGSMRMYDASIANTGTIVNNGLLSLYIGFPDGGYPNLYNSGAIGGVGSLAVGSNQIVVGSASGSVAPGTFINSGIVDQTSIDIAGTLVNTGKITGDLSVDGSVVNDGEIFGDLIVNGTWSSAGQIHGNIYSKGAGYFIHSGANITRLFGRVLGQTGAFVVNLDETYSVQIGDEIALFDLDGVPISLDTILVHGLFSDKGSVAYRILKSGNSYVAQVTAVPEAEGWAMALVGLLAFGLPGLRRRAQPGSLSLHKPLGVMSS
jgi:hypothetical protein